MLCFNGDIDGVMTALDNGADINEASGGLSGGTGLMYALHQGHNNVVQVLLNHPQIDVNKIGDINGWSALHWAVWVDNLEGLEALLAHQHLTTTTINHRGRLAGQTLGRSPIMCAVEYNAVNCFNLLVENPRVDLDTRDDFKRGPQDVLR